MLILYLAVLSAAMYGVARVLLPEMAKPSLPTPKKFLKPVEEIPAAVIEPEDFRDIRIRKLEALLTEKNKNIDVLQMELKIFYTQVVNFDKIKSLLEGEIQRLKEQNRIFRSELGLPTGVQPRESSEQLFL